MSAWSYPWAHMEPGHYFGIEDASDRARSRLSSAANAWCRRNPGVKIGTMARYNDHGRHIGWWAVRYDGCAIMPPETVEDYRKRVGVEYGLLTERGEQRRAARRKTVGDRVRFQRAQPIGTEAAGVEQPMTEVPADEADQWMRPREAGEVF